ncbi:MAG TPA: CBS domain-containing protein [Acidimicrobiales bacterium]|nr:CBS domain-containing protein [Acidimicrobiales bacterium]
MSGTPEGEPPSPSSEAPPSAVLHLSCLVNGPVVGPEGQRAGRLVDVIVRLGDGGHPPVSGLVVDAGGEDRFVPVADIESLDGDETRLKVEPRGLGRFERRRGEVLLSKDLSSRHLIHVEGARLVRANEIELACVGGRWQVIGVDTSSKPVLRRMLPRSLRERVRSGGVVDWADIEPFVGHVPTARLRIPFRKLARLHPAQLADLVEAASHEEGEEIIRAVGADRALEADVFEELDPEHQVEFLRSRSDEEAARVLAAMNPDDAVDLLAELDQDRRLPILESLPATRQRKIRALLSYHPESAGGLMNPDFVAVPESRKVSDALAAVKASTAPAEAAGVVFVTDGARHLAATVPVVELLRADPDAALASVGRPDPVTLDPDADLHEVIRKMTDFNLAVAPVVDEDGRILGQITVDDVLELMLPSGWRRQYGMASPD